MFWMKPIQIIVSKEFEHQIAELRGKYEAEQMSKAKLQEDMNKLRSQYDERVDQITKMSEGKSLFYPSSGIACLLVIYIH